MSAERSDESTATWNSFLVSRDSHHDKKRSDISAASPDLEDEYEHHKTTSNTANIRALARENAAQKGLITALTEYNRKLLESSRNHPSESEHHVTHELTSYLNEDTERSNLILEQHEFEPVLTSFNTSNYRSSRQISKMQSPSAIPAAATSTSIISRREHNSSLRELQGQHQLETQALLADAELQKQVAQKKLSEVQLRHLESVRTMEAELRTAFDARVKALEDQFTIRKERALRAQAEDLQRRHEDAMEMCNRDAAAHAQQTIVNAVAHAERQWKMKMERQIAHVETEYHEKYEQQAHDNMKIWKNERDDFKQRQNDWIERERTLLETVAQTKTQAARIIAAVKKERDHALLDDKASRRECEHQAAVAAEEKTERLRSQSIIESLQADLASARADQENKKLVWETERDEDLKKHDRRVLQLTAQLAVLDAALEEHEQTAGTMASHHEETVTRLQTDHEEAMRAWHTDKRELVSREQIVLPLLDWVIRKQSQKHWFKQWRTAAKAAITLRTEHRMKTLQVLMTRRHARSERALVRVFVKWRLLSTSMALLSQEAVHKHAVTQVVSRLSTQKATQQRRLILCWAFSEWRNQVKETHVITQHRHALTLLLHGYRRRTLAATTAHQRTLKKLVFTLMHKLAATRLQARQKIDRVLTRSTQKTMALRAWYSWRRIADVQTLEQERAKLTAQSLLARSFAQWRAKCAVQTMQGEINAMRQYASFNRVQNDQSIVKKDNQLNSLSQAYANLSAQLGTVLLDRRSTRTLRHVMRAWYLQAHQQRQIRTKLTAILARGGDEYRTRRSWRRWRNVALSHKPCSLDSFHKTVLVNIISRAVPRAHVSNSATEPQLQLSWRVWSNSAKNAKSLYRWEKACIKDRNKWEKIFLAAVTRRQLGTLFTAWRNKTHFVQYARFKANENQEMQSEVRTTIATIRSEFSKQNEATVGVIERLRQDARVLFDRNMELQSLLEIKTDEVRVANETIETARNEFKTLELQCDKQVQMLESSVHAVTAFRQQHDVLSAERSEMTATVNNERETSFAQLQMLEATTIQVRSQLATIAELQQRVADREHDIVLLRDQFTAEKGQLQESAQTVAERISLERDELKKQLQTYSIDMTKAFDKVALLEKQVSETHAEIMKLRQQLQNAQASVEALQVKHDKKVQELNITNDANLQAMEEAHMQQYEHARDTYRSQKKEYEDKIASNIHELETTLQESIVAVSHTFALKVSSVEERISMATKRVNLALTHLDIQEQHSVLGTAANASRMEQLQEQFEDELAAKNAMIAALQSQLTDRHTKLQAIVKAAEAAESVKGDRMETHIPTGGVLLNNENPDGKTDTMNNTSAMEQPVLPVFLGKKDDENEISGTAIAEHDLGEPSLHEMLDMDPQKQDQSAWSPAVQWDGETTPPTQSALLRSGLVGLDDTPLERSLGDLHSLVTVLNSETDSDADASDTLEQSLGELEPVIDSASQPVIVTPLPATSVQLQVDQVHVKNELPSPVLKHAESVASLDSAELKMLQLRDAEVEEEDELAYNEEQRLQKLFDEHARVLVKSHEEEQPTIDDLLFETRDFEPPNVYGVQDPASKGNS